MSDEGKTTIPMDATTTAYYQGAAAGVDVDEAMAAEWAGQPIAGRRCVYWLLVGRKAADITDQKLLEAFTMGAAVRQPNAHADEHDDDREVGRDRPSGDAIKRMVATFDVPDDYDKDDIADLLPGAFRDHSNLDVTVWEWSGFWSDVRDGIVGPDGDQTVTTTR